MGNTFSNTALFRPTEPSYEDDLENLIYIPELLDINVAKFWDDETFEIFSKKENINELRQKKFPALFFYYTGENKTRHTIIYFHSNSCDLGQVYDELEILHKHLHANILAIEFVGFGLCYLEGTASQYNINRRALAAYNFLRSLNIKSKNILLFGRSIGTGAATKLARNLKLMNHEIGGVILHSPYISIKVLVEDYVAYSSYIIENIYDNYENLKAVSNNDKSDTPLLIIHGNEDEIIPVSHSKYMMKNLQNMYKNASYPNESYHNYYYVVDDLGIPIKTFLHTLSKSKFGPNTDIYVPKQFFNKHDFSTRYKISAAKKVLDVHESNTRQNGKNTPLEKKIVAKSNLGSNANSKANSKSNSKADSNFNSNVRDGEKKKNKQNEPSNVSVQEKKKKETEIEIKNGKYDGLFNKRIDYEEENINETVMHKNKENTLKVYAKPKTSSNSEKQLWDNKRSEGHECGENKINIKVIKETHSKEFKTQSATNKSNNISSSIKKGSNGYCFSETDIKKCKNTVPKSSAEKGMDILFNTHSKYSTNEKTASRNSSKTSRETCDVDNEKSAMKDKNKQTLEQDKVDKANKKKMEMEKEREREIKTNTDSKQSEHQIKEKEEAKRKHIFENLMKGTNKIKERVYDNKKFKTENKPKVKEKIQLITNIFQNNKISFCQNDEECFNVVATSSNYACHKKTSNQKKEKEEMGTNSLPLGKPQNENENEEERKMKKIEIEGKKKEIEKELEREKKQGVEKGKGKKLEQTYKMNKVNIETEATEKKKIQQIETNRRETFNSKINKAKEKVNLVFEALNKSKYINEMQLIKKKYLNKNDDDDDRYSYNINKPTKCESNVKEIANEENIGREILREKYAVYEQEEKLENTEKNDNKKNILKMENDDINENEYEVKDFSYYVKNNIINKDKIKDFIEKVMDNFHEEEEEELEIGEEVEVEEAGEEEVETEEAEEKEDDIYNDFDKTENENNNDDKEEENDNSHSCEEQEESVISDTEKKQTESLKEIMIEKSAENQKREDISFE